MKLRFFVVSLTLALMAVGARAQGGLYFNPIVSRISNAEPDSGPFAFLGQNDTSQIFGGVMIGGYYDVYKAPKFDISLDLRDEIEHGDNSSLNSFLFSPRIAFKVKSVFKPYLQASLGDGRSRAALSPIHVTKFEYAITGGVDRPLNKHVDWRVIEIGYGQVTTMSSYLYAGPVAIPQAKLLNFSTGFVFRIP